jgi:prepilin-type N-terminal cleavage/methylation domain-containing protein
MKTKLTRGSAPTRRLRRGGYTLVELIVAVGLFAVVMTLATGAYLVMISVNRQTQALSVGINNLAFALETMTRNIRGGTNYSCAAAGAGIADCSSGGFTFSVTSPQGAPTTYTRSVSGVITETASGSTVDLTDPSINVTSLTFYVDGSTPGSDNRQPMVIITARGTVSSGPGGKTTPFTVETAAVMRGIDL